MKREDLRGLLEKAASNPDPFEIDVPEWGAKVQLLPFTEVTSTEFSEQMESLDEDSEVTPIAVIMATVIEHMVDGDGERVLDYDDEGDREIVQNLDLGGYRRCLRALQDRAMGAADVIEQNLGKGKRRRRRK